MKKILVLSASAFFILSCANNADKASTVTDTTKVAASSTTTPEVVYPYTATYSSQMETGDPKNAKMVLDIYKDYDNGNLLAHKEYFADSLTFELSNGARVSGPRDSVLNMAQKERNNMKAIEDHIVTFISSHAKDKDQNWVSVWTDEVDTHKDGKVDSVFLNENWLVNKAGKLAYMTQLAQKLVKK